MDTFLQLSATFIELTLSFHQDCELSQGKDFSHPLCFPTMHSAQSQTEQILKGVLISVHVKNTRLEEDGGLNIASFIRCDFSQVNLPQISHGVTNNSDNNNNP